LLGRQYLGSRTFPIPRDLEIFVQPFLVVGIVRVKIVEDRVLTNLESNQPVKIKMRAIDVSER
jgi:hypothetical protein